MEQNKFFEYYNSQNRAEIPPHKRVYNYLENNLHAFNYYGETYTAQETIDNKAGNCISLAILTTAYAKLANIQFAYSEVTTAPVYFKESNFQLISNHVRTKLYDPTFIEEDKMAYFYKPGIIVDYFPSRNNWSNGIATYDKFISMYYRNLAAKSLLKNDLNTAGWLTLESLKFAPNSLSAINLLAIIFRSLDYYDLSEKVYLHGLKYSKDNLNLLTNYQLLLVKQNKTIEAEQLQIKIDNAADPSPFRWLTLADEHYNNQKYLGAIKYYKKVIEIAPYLHHGYAGTAKSLYALDEKRASKKFMKIALEKTHEAKQEKLYKAKLAIFEKY
ncbi:MULTISPECIES: hypothetical protein [unclassified Pseudoalteromonas]|uniref:tetratricopeptide repeat protein n=1 Tax=unclassified Pseudoalteromonas TaxID=194690 RepID=UPI0005A75F25|nr:MULTISPECIES: hypothetical protein [unclassified Pseudoalteromonas]